MTTKEMNQSLARRARGGDAEARKALIEKNMPIVYSLVAKLCPGCADAISIGSIGLIKAADSYDPSLRYAFSTYAVKCVRNELLMEARRVKRHARELSIHTESANGMTFEEILPAPNDDFTRLEKEAARKVLADALLALPERERGMLMLFGEGAGQAQIARAFGVSQSYVSRLNNASIASLQHMLKDQTWILCALRA